MDTLAQLSQAALRPTLEAVPFREHGYHATPLVGGGIRVVVGGDGTFHTSQPSPDIIILQPGHALCLRGKSLLCSIGKGCGKCIDAWVLEDHLVALACVEEFGPGEISLTIANILGEMDSRLKPWGIGLSDNDMVIMSRRISSSEILAALPVFHEAVTALYTTLQERLHSQHNPESRNADACLQEPATLA